jgi:hypothetical protein
MLWSLNSLFFFSLPCPNQAPSASLCIAILNLHRDSIACGHQLIEHCCRLSRGLTNPEVDAGLLIDIMKQLLFSAKMMFVKAGQSQDLALCDRYIRMGLCSFIQWQVFIWLPFLTLLSFYPL